MIAPRAAWALVVLAIAACTGDFIITEDNCEPYSVRPCVCHTGGEGAQICAKNGWYFEKCECERLVVLTQSALEGVWQGGEKSVFVVDGEGVVEQAGAGQEGTWLVFDGDRFLLTDVNERKATLGFLLEGRPVAWNGVLDASAHVFTASKPGGGEVVLRKIRTDFDGWRCHPDWMGRADGCDCGCGERDEGCDGGVCDWCFDPDGKVTTC